MTEVMKIINAHMEGEDKNTKAVLSDIMESVNELETLVQPCDDAISREAVLSLFDKSTFASWDLTLLEHRIKDLPPVTQKSGEWINDDDIPMCSRCGYIPQYDRTIDDYEYSNYCPYCGCRMVEPQESEG